MSSQGEKEYDDNKIIKNCLEIIGKLNETYRNLNFSDSFALDQTVEIKECLLWCLNILNELISLNTKPINNITKEELNELKKAEYTVILKI